MEISMKMLSLTANFETSYNMIVAASDLDSLCIEVSFYPL